MGKRDAPLEYWIGGATEEVCRQTRGKCYCKSQWPYEGTILRGCQRPDDDPHGSWCIIDQNDANCRFDRDDDDHKVITKEGNFTGDYWQYCNSYYCPFGSGVAQKGRCERTTAGCTCKQKWSYMGGDGILYEYQGCANPDNDERGEWCVVDLKTCVNTPPGQKEVKIQTNETWDHCECKQSAPLGKVSTTGQKSAFMLNSTIFDDCDMGRVPACMRH
eukprot:TRINITY_DN20281_c0_g1_i3.p2 TRINITY_DN20281_c0_g1~~TRINITY_DN20281_c0_g1_i3.p2  ORF type:complete len:217 (+),score=28.57 TRINITY_DN20281_c0_g1_i3:837-1487(+)